MKVDIRFDLSLYSIKSWLAKTKEQIIYYLNGGYTCSECGRSTRFYNPDIVGTVNGTTMILSNFVKENVCPSCLAKNIETYFNSATKVKYNPHIVQNKNDIIYTDKSCYWYKDEKNVVNIIFGFDSNSIAYGLKLNVRFGSNSWNSTYASLKALKELLTETGYCETTCVVYSKSYTKRRFVNRVGTFERQSVKDFN